MKKFLIIGSIAIAAALGMLFFASLYQPKVKVADMITPSPFVATPEPTPSPTPEIEIMESYESKPLIFLEFHYLLDVMPMNQYNYVMVSTNEFFNSMYQAAVRNYSFEQYNQQYTDILHKRFSFADDDALAVVFDRFKDVFIGSNQEYMFIMDNETFKDANGKYTFTVNLYINSQEAAAFEFAVNKNTSVIKIS